MYFYSQPPPWGPPVYTPPMNPTSPPPSGVNIKELRKVIKFYTQLLKEEEDKKKGKDDKKKDDDKKKPSAFTALQWTALLIMFSPLLGLFYLKMLASLASSIPH